MTDPPTLSVERDVVAAVIRQSAALTVHAAAEPRPRFRWYNGSTSLTSSTAEGGRRVDVTTTADDDDDDEDRKTSFRYASTLTLSSVDVWDLTEYRVVVSNDYGSEETSLRLTRAS